MMKDITESFKKVMLGMLAWDNSAGEGRLALVEHERGFYLKADLVTADLGLPVPGTLEASLIMPPMVQGLSRIVNAGLYEGMPRAKVRFNETVVLTTTIDLPTARSLAKAVAVHREEYRTKIGSYGAQAMKMISELYVEGDE